MRWVGGLLLVVSLIGCASLPGRSAPTTSARRSAESGSDEVTKARINQLQRQAAMAEAEIKLLRRQLAALGVEVERLAAVEARPAPPAVSYRPPTEPLERPATSRAIESSDLEPVTVAPPSAPTVEAHVEAYREPAAMPVDPPATSSAADPTSGRPSGPSSGAASRPATAAVPPAGQSIYDRGYTLYHQGRYVDAETSFQRFLQAHGDTELADNAQFWIGESRFARNDHMGALLAFQEVLDRYPSGNKIADALLKTGDCLVELDNRASGLERFEEVLRRFPGSAAAAMAEERLGRPGG